MSKHDHDLGFAHDLPLMIGRRRALSVIGGAGLASMGAMTANALECVALPWETQGPFPADGSNSRDGSILNVLTEEGVVRQDIRSSFGSLSGEAEGVQLDLELSLVSADGCTPLARHAIYVWHCDALGDYSLYNVTEQNYLRGVGVADDAGKVQFTTIFPGCYDGRWPHIHFEIYETIDKAVSGEASILTAQLAMPEKISTEVYAGDKRYTNGTRNLGRISIASDNVFADNSEAQIAQQTPELYGNNESGYYGSVVIPIDPNADRSTQMGPPPGNGKMPPPPKK